MLFVLHKNRGVCKHGSPVKERSGYVKPRFELSLNLTFTLVPGTRVAINTERQSRIAGGTKHNVMAKEKEMPMQCKQSEWTSAQP